MIDNDDNDDNDVIFVFLYKVTENLSVLYCFIMKTVKQCRFIYEYILLFMLTDDDNDDIVTMTTYFQPLKNVVIFRSYIVILPRISSLKGTKKAAPAALSGCGVIS